MATTSTSICSAVTKTQQRRRRIRSTRRDSSGSDDVIEISSRHSSRSRSRSRSRYNRTMCRQFLLQQKNAFFQSEFTKNTLLSIRSKSPSAKRYRHKSKHSKKRSKKHRNRSRSHSRSRSSRYSSRKHRYSDD